jgi:hypothetical protein
MVPDTARAFRFTLATHDPEAVASACRSVGLDFVNRVARRADLPSVMAWTRDYRRITLPGKSALHWSPLTNGASEPSGLHETSWEARRQVAAELERAKLVRKGANFADDCVRHGLVTPTYNTLLIAPRRNECGWVPVDMPDVPLAARVLALFAVDFLWAPTAYYESLTVCPVCSAIAFSGRAHGRRWHLPCSCQTRRLQ